MSFNKPLIHDANGTKYFVDANAILQPTEARERFRKHFLEVPVEEHGKQWASLWNTGDFLPWDKFCASPALEDLMKNKDNLDIFKNQVRKRALVPGCGRGYDVLLFAEHGYDTVGIEISGAAVREAKKWAASQLRNRSDTSGIAHCEFLLGDFFDDEWLKVIGVEERGGFDLVYDYAFLVAMNPTLRKKWAQRMAQLIAPGTGLLVCLEYPLFRPAETGGPPHGIASSDYDMLLRGDFEKVMHYMPKRTHQVGEGSDMISVWRRKEQAKL